MMLKMWSVCTVSVLDDKDLWLLQVEIDVYTLLKKVNDVELWSVCAGWQGPVATSGGDRCLHTAEKGEWCRPVCTVSVLDDKDLWLPQVKIDVYTLLKKVNGVEIWTLCIVITMDDKDLVDKIIKSSCALMQ